MRKKKSSFYYLLARAHRGLVLLEVAVYNAEESISETL